MQNEYLNGLKELNFHRSHDVNYIKKSLNFNDNPIIIELCLSDKAMNDTQYLNKIAQLLQNIEKLDEICRKYLKEWIDKDFIVHLFTSVFECYIPLDNELNKELIAKIADFHERVNETGQKITIEEFVATLQLSKIFFL